MINKLELLAQLRSRIAIDLAALERRQKDTQDGATHEESRSEHAKDTRATEQSYLARGLADRVTDLARTAIALAKLELHDFAENDPIAVGAVVEISTAEFDADEHAQTPEVAEAASIEGRAQRVIWFLVPGAGGVDLEQDGLTVRTVTPVSPLGRALLGLSTGEEGTVRTPRGVREFEVIRVD